MPQVQTGHKTFDRKAYISTGNVLSDTQTSLYVRPFTKTECNGFVRPQGHLQDYDLNQFKDLPFSVREFVKRRGYNEMLCVYKIFHYRKAGPQMIHGWIVTDYNRRVLRKWYTSNREKSIRIIEACAKAIEQD